MTRSDSLTRYRQKRDFAKTPEPEGILAAKGGRHYLIQKHAASRLHYDFRLELDGTLKSWAITRGPSIDPGDKRLAVEVEDHPVSYGSFEGIIPKGQYGGGTVMLWDEGEWEPIGDPHKGLAKGKLEFRLHGERLKGEWTLVRMRDREKDKGRHNWLLIKRTDKYAKEGKGDAFLKKHDTSVTSGRSMEKIASSADRVWQSNQKKPTPKQAATSKRTTRPRKKSNIVLPKFTPPQLATLTDAVPKGEKWVHEIKFDGYRALAYIMDGKVKMVTRSGKDWTDAFAPVAKQLATLPVHAAILDGEIVSLNEEGVSSFKMLQESLSEGHLEQLQYYAFDLLFLDGKDLRHLPLTERKAQLKPLIEEISGGTIFYSEHFAEEEDFLQRVCGMQLEGIISKLADSRYSSGRGKSWLKTKCHKRQEFVIGGFTEPTHKTRGIGALLLGVAEEEEFVYCGKVGTGFDQKTSRDLRKRLDALEQKASPFIAVPTDAKRGAHWVAPKLVCEVEFTEWTSEGRLRHPSYQGLREDKPAKAVHRDRPIAPTKKAQKAKINISTSKRKGASVGNITITHPERIIYPGTDITKEDLAAYYHQVSDHILPYLKDRPLSMVRCPEGIGKSCFFQRHVGKGQFPHVHEAAVKVKSRKETYVKIMDEDGLLSLVQWGVIEMHPWGALSDKPDTPDYMIFDLDPDPEAAWKDVVAGALEVRERMKEFGLKSFLKTTGGKGLHVTVPLTRKYTWPTVKAFARAIAESMAHDNPKRYIATASKAKRKGKIFVDYLRNDLTATAVVPYSARARDGATVATPITWEELSPKLDPSQFTIKSIPKRLDKLSSDPWKDFFSTRQTIKMAHLKALKITPE